MLQKNDCGISILDVVKRIREKYSDDFSLLLRMENIASQVEELQLKNLKYDENYLKQHISFYDAKKAPHFNEKTPEGVFNAEYDCSFENIEKTSFEDIISWIKKDS